MAKKPEQKKPINRAAGGDRAPVTNDSRFASVHSDPRFAMPRRKDVKIAIDKRFARMLKDDDFAQKAAVDRYGRKLAKDAGKEEIKRYYRMKDEDEGEDEDEDEHSGDEDELETNVRYDPARGEGIISSSEESSDEDGDEVDENEEEAISREALYDANNIPTGEVTARLAAVNLDWDNVAAVDLMATFSSFAPTEGKVLRVTVYPSEFGRERMEKENMEGPPSDIFKSKEEEEDIGPDDEVTAKAIIKEDNGQDFDSAKLRNYQLERLRYYYAVIETDKPSTAYHIYTQCDGTEYEATANFFDLRFIPDDTSFENDTPRDQCTDTPENYKPNDFVTDALQHSKAKLTWDEDDSHRKVAAKRAFSQKEVEEMDVQAYLASDSDSEADKTSAKEKYRALLSGPLARVSKKSNGPTGIMEVTFTSGLSTKDKTVKVIQEDETAETTIEKYARKEKERKQRRKEKAQHSKTGIPLDAAPDAEEAVPAPQDPAAVDLGFDDPFFASEPVPTKPKKEKKKTKEQRVAETAEQASKHAELELLMADTDKDGLNHFDMKQVVKSEKSRKGKHTKKRSRQAEEAIEEGAQKDFEIDVKDPRFAAVYEKHEFAIDPTNPRFVKTKAMEKLLDERRRRTRGGGDQDEEVFVRKKAKVGEAGKGDEVGRLVQSLKNRNKSTKR